MAKAHPGRVGRRLAAIVAADVAGYSRLMGIDEVGTARTLREHRAVTDALVAKHGGRIVKTTGDGVLLEFPSVVDAVECAVALQAIMAERNQGVPQDRCMLFRIGINLGDILVEDEDILGDGVNVAARLEGIAEPGGIILPAILPDASLGLGRCAVNNWHGPPCVVPVATRTCAGCWNDHRRMGPICAAYDHPCTWNEPHLRLNVT